MGTLAHILGQYSFTMRYLFGLLVLSLVLATSMASVLYPYGLANYGYYSPLNLDENNDGLLDIQDFNRDGKVDAFPFVHPLYRTRKKKWQRPQALLMEYFHLETTDST